MTVDLGALSCAARGWHVFPVHTVRNGRCSCGGLNPKCKPGKHPVAALVPHGLKDASCDPAILSDWWQQIQDANVGIATGAVSGLVILDVDPAHGGEDTLHELELVNGELPQTVEVVTGSGGRHVYFRHPGVNVPNSAGTRLGIGLDIRGDGGYVVGPPSTHISGNRYEWEIVHHPDTTSLADMPQWLLTLAIGPTAPNNGHVAGASIPPSLLPMSKQALDFVANGAPVGQQRARALHAARSYLGAGYSVQDTAEAIWRGLQVSPIGDPARLWTYQDALDIANDLASKPAPPPAPLNKQPSPGLPVIYSTCPNLATVTTECWTALQQANSPDPRYFRHGSVPSRIETDDQGVPVIRELTADRLRHELARIARWRAKRESKIGTWIESDARPPLDVMRDILATPDPPLPVLSRIVEVPVFAADGALQTTPGYHPAARTFYAPAPGVRVSDIPSQPAAADIQQARDLILDMLCDFPFIADADRAGAVALLLLPFVRDMIDGPTPNHLVEAPTAGCGKGLLADCLLVPSVGSHVGIVTIPRDEDEFRKRLTAQLKEGRAAVLLDNVTQLDSSVLAAVLTAPTWDDRVLGKTEMLSLAVRCAWVTTANNPTMSTEIARRCVRIRLDPKVDRPWQREGFRHPNLRGWVHGHRGELAGAALILTQSWIAASRPQTVAKPLGSYERWAEVIGGILQHAGIPGFLANLNEFYEVSDLEGAVWRQFVSAWWEKHHENEVGTAELFPLAQGSDLFDLGKGGERSQRTTFGKLLGKQRDRVIGEYRITQTGVTHKAKTWRLLPIKNLIDGEQRGTLGTLGNISQPLRVREKIVESIEEVENVPQRSQCSPEHPQCSPTGLLFDVTEDWQALPEGVITPNGCEYRLNMSSGRREVRLDPQAWMPSDEEDSYAAYEGV